MSNTPLPQSLPPVTLDLTSVLNLWKRDTQISLNCHGIATIQSFDPVKQMAQAQMTYKKTRQVLNAQTQNYEIVLKDYPALLDCPVIFLGGGPAALTFPVAAGDECLVLFNDRDLDNWLTNGEAQPNTPRLHAFTDAILLVGLRSNRNALAAFDGARADLRNGSTHVRVGASLVGILNNQFTLNTLLQELNTDLQNLVTAIKAIMVTCPPGGGPSGPPLNQAALIAAANALSATATKFGQLLE